MELDPLREDDEPQDAPRRQAGGGDPDRPGVKKPYVRPELVAYGDVITLTLQQGKSPAGPDTFGEIGHGVP